MLWVINFTFSHFWNPNPEYCSWPRLRPKPNKQCKSLSNTLYIEYAFIKTTTNATHSGPLNPGGQSHFPVTWWQMAPFLQGHSSEQSTPKLCGEHFTEQSAPVQPAEHLHCPSYGLHGEPFSHWQFSVQNSPNFPAGHAVKQNTRLRHVLR